MEKTLTKECYEENIRNLKVRLTDPLDDDTRLVLVSWLSHDERKLQTLLKKQ